MSNSTYWLNAGIYNPEARQAAGHLSRINGFPFTGSFGGECPGVYYHRLQRDGWRLCGHQDEKGDRSTLFEKELPRGWILQKAAHASVNHPAGKGCYWDTHCLHHPSLGLDLDYPAWEWADWDKDRLVWVQQGVLKAATIKAKGLGTVRDLHDFNAMTFEGVEAPY